MSGQSMGPLVVDQYLSIILNGLWEPFHIEISSWPTYMREFIFKDNHYLIIFITLIYKLSECELNTGYKIYPKQSLFIPGLSLFPGRGQPDLFLHLTPFHFLPCGFFLKPTLLKQYLGPVPLPPACHSLKVLSWASACS